MNRLAVFFLATLFFSFETSVKAESEKIQTLGEHIQCLQVGETDEIGGIPGPKGWPTKCCKGLTDRPQAQHCGNTLLGGYAYICLSCGDDKCDKKFETACNCPEDCKKP